MSERAICTTKFTHVLNYIGEMLLRIAGIDKNKISDHGAVFGYAEKLRDYDILRYGAYRSLVMDRVLPH